MSPSERRQRLRRILQGKHCVHPGSIFDPISARLAERAGYELAILPGSIAAAAILGVPDLVLLTLTELTDHVRRITRATGLSVMVDADHGYGNALNVMRTVEELESAGAAAISLEDTSLPAPYGHSGEEMISKEEMVGKLKAAVHSRTDPSLVIIARTNALRSSSLSDCLDRLGAYARTGVDAVMIVGAKAETEVEAVGRSSPLPVVLGNIGAKPPEALTNLAVLAASGVRIALQPHLPFLAALKAENEALRHLQAGGKSEGLIGTTATEEFFSGAVRRDDYALWQREFLLGEPPMRA